MALLDGPEEADASGARHRLELRQLARRSARTGARTRPQAAPLPERAHALAELALDARAEHLLCRRRDESVVLGRHPARVAPSVAHADAELASGFGGVTFRYHEQGLHQGGRRAGVHVGSVARRTRGRSRRWARGSPASGWPICRRGSSARAARRSGPSSRSSANGSPSSPRLRSGTPPLPRGTSWPSAPQVSVRDPEGKERVVVVASADEIGLVPHAASATSPSRGRSSGAPRGRRRVQRPRGLEELTVVDVASRLAARGLRSRTLTPCVGVKLPALRLALRSAARGRKCRHPEEGPPQRVSSARSTSRSRRAPECGVRAAQWA